MGPAARLHGHYTVQAFTKPGDGHAADMVKLILPYTQDGGDPRTASFILKRRNPSGNVAMNSFMKGVFTKEIELFSVLAPKLDKILLDLGESRGLAIPQCFYSSLEDGKECLVMEDLSVKGFVVSDKTRSLRVSEAQLVLKELARLHGAALLLQ